MGLELRLDGEGKSASDAIESADQALLGGGRSGGEHRARRTCNGQIGTTRQYRTARRGGHYPGISILLHACLPEVTRSTPTRITSENCLLEKQTPIHERSKEDTNPFLKSVAANGDWGRMDTN